MEDKCWSVRLVETLCRCARCVSVEACGWLVGNFVCGLLTLPSSFGLALGAMLTWRRGRRGVVGWPDQTMLCGRILCFVLFRVVKLCDFVMKVMKSGLCPLVKKKKKCLSY
jgi:hypothetical protein